MPPGVAALSLLVRPDGRPYPGLNGDRPVYVVGDIHGRADLLARLHVAIDREAEAVGPGLEIYLGDYVDRGPGSRQTLDALIARARTHAVVTLRGNHEEIFQKVLSGRETVERWRSVGGLETIVSYGVDVGAYLHGRAIDGTGLLTALRAALPAGHLAFLEALRPLGLVDDYVFVHAGLRPHRTLAEQSPRDLHWIRGDFLDSTVDFGRIVVHGHTPVRAVDCRQNRINLDTGAYLSGQLTCLKIDRTGARVLPPA